MDQQNHQDTSVNHGESIVDKAAAYVADILKNNLSEDLVYHNYRHTKNVVKAAQKIGTNEGLNDGDLEILILAAWFHDTGFSKCYIGHEEISKEIAELFLRDHEYDEEKVRKVGEIILATHYPPEPKNLLEKILCDADFIHFGKKSYFEKLETLRKEKEIFLGQTYTDLSWMEENLAFLKDHHYFTTYAQEELEPGKLENQKAQKKMLKKLRKQVKEKLSDALNVDEDRIKDLAKKYSKVQGRADRGIETMFRLTSRNHISLSSMADSKANIMISVNSIIITILIGALIPKLDNNPHLLIPTFVMLSLNLVSVIFAILATRPNITKGVFTRESIERRQVNLLFFGNFHKMSRAEYQWGMQQMLNDGEYLYSSLIDDIYFLGVVLGKKYHFLRISYTIFMFGLIITVLTFFAVNVFFLPEPN